MLASMKTDIHPCTASSRRREEEERHELMVLLAAYGARQGCMLRSGQVGDGLRPRAGVMWKLRSTTSLCRENPSLRSKKAAGR